MKKRITFLFSLIVFVLSLMNAVNILAAPALTGEETAEGFTVFVPEGTNGMLFAAVYDSETDALKRALRPKPNGKGFGVPCGAEEYVRAFYWNEKQMPLTKPLELRHSTKTVGAIALSEENVWSTDRQTENGVGNLFDNNTKTYMAGRAVPGKPVVITAELDRFYDISELKIGFTNDPARVYRFDAEASVDGEDYFPLIDVQSSNPSTDAAAAFPTDARAKFVRVRIFGHSGQNDGWVRVNCFALSGAPANDTRELLMKEDLSGLSGNVSTNENSDGWFVRALDEETYKDYTPRLGENLTADYASLGDGHALRIHDAADRQTGSGGAGAAAAFRVLTLPNGNADYTLAFRLLIDKNSENINWSGFSLLSEPVSGGADLTPAAAIQLRFEENGGKAKIKLLNSVQFNEGDLCDCFNESFALGVSWDVTVKVSPAKRSAAVTISDGSASETRLLGFAYTDAERVNNQTWTNSAVRCLAVNSGAGGKADIYVNGLTVFRDFAEGDESEEKTLYSQNFETASSIGAAGITQKAVKSEGNGSDSSLGNNLQATVAASGTFGGHVLKLTDNDGGNGLLVSVPLKVPDNGNKYIIKWRMRDFDPGNYSGFSLASGSPSGFGDKAHPFAFQLRYNLQDGSDGGGNGIQLYRYSSPLMNGGSYGLFAAGGGSRLAKNSEWAVQITVNPLSKSLEFALDGGGRSIRATADFASVEGDFSESWDEIVPNTLVFHTGASSKADCIIDDIEVIDTGVRGNPASDPIHGIVRLEAQWGYGKFITQNGGAAPTASANVDPNLTRFVERSGLIGTGVSFESMTRPGYYLVAKETGDTGENDANHAYELALEPFENTAQYRAWASFEKKKAVNTGEYTGTTVSYAPVWDTERLMCYTANSSDPIALMTLKDSDYTHSALIYLRSEAVSFVSDNFKGDKLNSQWWTNLPWKKNNQTRDSYNFTALIDYRNVIVENGELFLKATKIADNDLSDNAKNLEGKDGKDYNGEYGKNDYKKWAGRVGVVSIQNKVFNRQCMIEGSFKQPDSPIGYWNAFWLAGRDSWPPEIDIFEFLSSNFGHSAWNANIHGEGDKNNLFGRSSVKGIDLTAGYHTFTLDWGYNYIKMYVDGKVYQSANNHATIDYQKNMRLILNAGVGGWEKEPDSTMVWNDGMRVKWIRSFKY